MKYKAIIIDDEKHARAAIRGLIESNVQEIEILDEAKNLPDGVKLIHKLNPNLVFLDIEMPGYSGLEILEFFETEKVDFHIVFTTAYSKYALNAFELSAVDYLVKPIQLEHIQRVINKLGRIENLKYKTLKENLNKDNDKKASKIILNTGSTQFVISVNDIIYIKADGSYSNVHLKNGEKHCISKRIAEFEVLEDLGYFLRIHRSHIINLNYVEKIIKNDGGSVVLSNGEEFSINKDKKTQLEKLLVHLKI